MSPLFEKASFATHVSVRIDGYISKQAILFGLAVPDSASISSETGHLGILFRFQECLRLIPCKYLEGR